mgnify:CR=1 FL=1
MRKIHDGKKLFACEICSEKSFTRKADLKRHVQMVHEGFKPYSCEICGKSFATRKSDLRRHIETVHEGKRPYKCELCNKGFARKDNFKTHQANGCANENKAKPQQCTFCDFSCQYMTEIKKHLELVHGEKQVYTCHLCAMSYTEKNSLKYHIGHTHEGKKKVPRCTICKINYQFRRELKAHVIKVKIVVMFVVKHLQELKA